MLLIHIEVDLRHIIQKIQYRFCHRNTSNQRFIINAKRQ